MKKVLSVILTTIIILGILSVNPYVMAEEVSSSKEEVVTSETESSTEATNPVVKVSRITLSKTSYRYNRSSSNGRLRLISTVYPTNASNKAVKWTTSNNKIATVDSSGMVTLKSKGMVYITATSKDGSNKSARCKINVVQKVTNVKLNKTNLHFSKKSKCKLKVTLSPVGVSSKSVSWKSSNKKVATVSKKGIVKAKKKGYCTITVTAKDGSKKSAKCLVVVGTKVKGIKLNKAKISITKDKSYSLKATVTNKNAVYKSVSWSTTNSKVATVNSKGVVKGINKGSCYIKVTAKDGSKESAKCKVTVVKLVSKITLNKTKLDIEYGGKSVKLKATVSSDASNKAVKWSTTNSKVATVSKKGVVKATGIGNATIKATAKDGSKKSASCKVTSKPTLYQKLSKEQFRTKVCVNMCCDYLNDYFESCGAIINPNMADERSQNLLDTVSGDLVTDNISIYDHAVEIVCGWTYEMASDELKNGCPWKDIKSEGKDFSDFIDEVGSIGTASLKTYNPTKMMDMNWNGWKWYCDLLKSENDPLYVYVNAVPEKSKFGDTFYTIYMHWDTKGNLEYRGIPLP